MQQIPIRINRKGPNSNEIAFKIFPIQKKLLISHRRQKTFNSMQKQNDQINNLRKHDTLDPNRTKGESRYRRISSSSGTHKFPKDFFNNNDLPGTPIKIRLGKAKRENLLSSATQSRTGFNNTQSQQYKLQTKKYFFQSPERNCQKLICQVQTPKFNLKDLAEDQLYETKSRTTNKKNKMEEYLSHKKQQFPTFFKQSSKKEYLNDEEDDNNNQIDKKTTLFGQNLKDKESQVLLQTLGKKVNVVKQPIPQIKKRRRIYSHMEKQNRVEPALQNKITKKSIKAFLSTKGFNWKILQKVNQMKCISGEEQKGFSLNLKQQKGLLGLRLSKRLSQKIEQNENMLDNTFRIRKCA